MNIANKLSYNEIHDRLLKIVNNKQVLINEPMLKHTSLKIGGNADFYVVAKDYNQVINIIKFAKDNNIQITVVGNGTNLLVRDNGIRGITLKILTNNIRVSNNEVIVDSGVSLPFLAIKLQKIGLSGLEFASGIPGSIGGAIRMNAGAYGREMKDIIIETTYLDENCEIKKINNKEHEFSYRHSIFSDKPYIILSSKLKLIQDDKNKIKEKMNNIINDRKEKQPVNMPSAGSTFRRGKNFIAAKLIDECGLKGYKIGGASVSTIHSGFVVNNGNATAEDVINLTEYIKKKVKEKFNVNLELEIEIVGE